MKRIGINQITPSLTRDNWIDSRPYKIEIINGERYTTLPIDSWGRQLLAEPYIIEGFYRNEETGEIMRVFGDSPEYVVYFFIRL